MKKVLMIVVIVMTLMIAVVCSSLVAAKPIPGCVLDSLDPLADSDKDGEYDFDEDLMDSNPCDPCSPNTNSDACLIQQEGYCIKYLSAKPDKLPVYGKSTSKISFEIMCSGDYDYERTPKIGILRLPKELTVGEPMEGEYIVPKREDQGANEKVTITIRHSSGKSKSITIYFENKAMDVLKGETVWGKCSEFGGKDDIWIDKKLRKKFYNERLPIGIKMSYEEFFTEYFKKNPQLKKDFDNWMNEPKQKRQWNKVALSLYREDLYGRVVDEEIPYYCAMRWPPYHSTGPWSKAWLRNQRIKVTNIENGKSVIVEPVDYGPNVSTKRDIDLSPKARMAIGAKTDSMVEISLDNPNAKLGPVQASFIKPRVKELIKSFLPLIIVFSAIALGKLVEVYLKTRKTTHKKRRR